MKFRKKPVVIEAIQFLYNDDNIKQLKEFCGEALGDVKKYRTAGSKAEAEIKTLEDGTNHFVVKHIATEGDWIIKGVHGEFYACKPDIFDKTYELVDETGEA